MNISSILDRLADRRDMDLPLAHTAFAALMDGEMSPAQAGAFLLTLRAKGETSVEMAAAVSAAMERARLVTGIEGDYIDIVGTGGDGKHSFNCSTATALTMAGLGYQVVKHGNRAVSSSCGAGDVLESAGYPLDLGPDGIRESVRRLHFAFAFAPHFHPCFKHIAPIRRELGVRTLFNLLGPLINPARPAYMMLGVANDELVPVIAASLAESGHYKRALVLHGAGGYDEVTAFGRTHARLVEGGRVTEMEIDPVQLGFTAPAGEGELKVESKEEAREVLMAVLQGKGNPAMMDMLALNVAVAISLFEPDLDRHLCVARAREAVSSGVGGKVLEKIMKQRL